MIGSQAGQETVASDAARGAAFAKHDWAMTALGPLPEWPSALRTAVSLLLASPVPMALWWGPDATVIHNDAHSRIFGEVQGMPGAQAWPDRWATWAPLIEQVRGSGTAAWLEQDHLAAALSPVFDDTGKAVGVLSIVTEARADTGLPSRSVMRQPYGLDGMTEGRRADALARLSAALGIATTAQDVIRAVAAHTGSVLGATQHHDPGHPGHSDRGTADPRRPTAVGRGAGQRS